MALPAPRSRVLLWPLALSALTLAGATPALADKDRERSFCLTILHNNDAESQLLNAGADLEDFGGAARFVTVVRRERRDALASGCKDLAGGDARRRGVVTLSSGDNFLPGPEFDASLEKGVPFYDSIVVARTRYDALAIGNHEFDFGPDVLADFIEGVRGRAVFLSANLDLGDEPRLQALADEGRIAKSIVVRERGERIGIVGATTEDLRFISTPRDVVVGEVAPAVQAEVDALLERGIDKIILISHLQSVDEDIMLLATLRGIDIAIAGGGDELLANPDALLVPGDEAARPYPIVATDADGDAIPVVTTAGSYKYVGRLEVLFDDDGYVIDAGGGPVRVAGGDNQGAVAPDPVVEQRVTEPVAAFVEDLANTVIATSEVALEGRRAPGVRTEETNLGNLIADALLFEARRRAPDFGVESPVVALQNGGGIRNDTLIPAGEITELDTFDIAPFANFVAVVESVPPEQFKEIMENAVADVAAAGGRFAQISGFSFVYDPAGTAQVLDEEQNVITPGTRVRSITLDDGTPIVEDGTVVPDAPAVDIATIDFLARGGDQYPFRDAPFVSVGLSYQQALSNYVQDGLSGVISAADYPEGGEGRITATP